MEKNSEKLKKRETTQCRSLVFIVETRQGETEETSQQMIVQGYAAVFNTPTELFEIDGIKYREQIDARAFDNAKMDDVIFNYNHEGRVYARTRNGTLKLEIREKGLWIEADIGGTEEGRKLYEEIKGGYIDRMSFQFTVKQETFDKENHLWTVKEVNRLYDVAAVSIPAYDDTLIEARKKFAMENANGAYMEHEKDMNLRRRKLELRTKIFIM